MGKTQFITTTTREYALLARLEGQVRGLLKVPSAYNDDTRPAREALRDTLTLLAKHRKSS